MNRLFKYILTIYCLFAIFADISAQRNPISGNLVISPPYSPFITDLTNSFPDRINLSLLLSDANQPAAQIRLKVTLKGQGLTIQTRDIFQPPPIDIDFNIPLLLSGADLESYFNPQNLNYQGRTGQGGRLNFRRNGTLPEGLYELCIEAFDYRRFTQEPLSDPICFFFNVMLHEPPIILNPKGEQQPVLPQNLLFTWIPQHVATFNADYTLYLYEKTNPNDVPFNVIQGGGILIDSFQTNINTYHYTGIDPLLEYGKEYVIRVRASDPDGLQIFQNNGYSPIESFVYGGDCSAPFDLEGVANEYGEIALNWGGDLYDPPSGNAGNANPVSNSSNNGATVPLGNNTTSSPLGNNLNNPISGGLDPTQNSSNSTNNQTTTINTSDQFIIEYRNINSASEQWNRKYTYANEYLLAGLEMGQSYEIRIGLICWGNIELFSDMIEVQMSDYFCGVDLRPFDLETSLLNQLQVGDSIYAGDFKIIIHTVLGGSNGRFTGTGYMSMPFLNFARLNVKFVAATFNDEHRLIDGFFRVEGIGLQGLAGGWVDWLDQLMDVAQTLDDFLNVQDVIVSQVQELVTFANTFMPADVVTGLNDALDALNNATTQEQIDEAMEDLQDAIDAFNAALEILLNANYTIEFSNDASSKNGHDRKGETDLSSNYEDPFAIGNSSDSVIYTPDWKSVPSFGAEFANAKLLRHLNGSTKNWQDSTIFKTASGIEIPAILENEKFKLTLTGGEHESITDVFAVEQYIDSSGNVAQHIAGKMKVISLNSIQKNVFIVPVNGATLINTIENIETSINSIYKGPAVTWKVKQIENFESSFDNTMDDDPSGIWSNYSAEMRKIKSDFRNWGTTVDDNEDYIIFVCKASEDPGKMGYMPRSKNYGFIFEASIGQSRELLDKTIAHELAHGAFHLKHTWEEHGGVQPKGTTLNLMDSKDNGIELKKWQWLYIHNPQPVGLFPEDEDAEYSDSEYFKKLLQQIRCAYASGLNTIELPLKYHSGGNRVQVVFGQFCFDYHCTNADPNCITNGPLVRSAFWSVENPSIPIISNILNPTFDGYKINYTNFIISPSSADYTYNDLQLPREHFQNFLKPSTEDLVDEFNYVWARIKVKLAPNKYFDNQDLRELKLIACCASKYFNYLDRLAVIEKILDSKTFITEYYEDLILDLFASTPQGLDSKLTYDQLITDYELMKHLYNDFHNYGGEPNARRLGLEIHQLFDRGFSVDEKEQFYNKMVINGPDSSEKLNQSKLLYFNGFNELHCEWDIKARFDKPSNKFIFSETIISNREIDNVTAGGGFTCDIDYDSYSFKIDDLVAVNILRSSNGMDIFESPIIVMPAFTYFAIIKAHENDITAANLENLLFLVTTFTPFDEIWFFGKAIELGSKSLRSMRFAHAKSLALIKKIEVPTNSSGTHLKNIANGKVDNLVKFIGQAADGFWAKFENFRPFIKENKIYPNTNKTGNPLAEISETADGFVVDATNGPAVNFTENLPVNGVKTVENVTIKYKEGDEIIEVVGDVKVGPQNGPEHCIYGNKLCLVAGTKIKMYGFYNKPIETIKNGDWVESFNTTTNTIFSNEVLDLNVNINNQLTSIYIAGKKIECTPSHLFWQPNKNRWIEAKYLRKGDLLLSNRLNQSASTYTSLHRPRSDLEIDSVVTIDTLVEVYTISLGSKPASYFVGDYSILTTDNCIITSLRTKLGETKHNKLINIAISRGLNVREKLRLYKYLDGLNQTNLDKMFRGLDEGADLFQDAIFAKFRNSSTPEELALFAKLEGDILASSLQWIDFTKTTSGFYSWKQVADLTTNLQGWRKFFSLLQEISNIRANQALLTRLTSSSDPNGIVGLSRILNKNIYFTIPNCTNCNHAFPQIDELLRIIRRTHEDLPINGFTNRALNGMKTAPEISRGNWFELKEALNETVTEFSPRLPNGKIGDFEVENILTVECKSTGDIVNKFNHTNNASDYDQLLGYLERIEDIDDLAIRFHALPIAKKMNMSFPITRAKINQIELFARNEMHVVFNQDPNRIFNAMNPILKNNLEINFVTDLNNIKIAEIVDEIVKIKL